MKKIVLLSDGKSFSDKTFRFIQSLQQQEKFLLTGAFFHSINYELLIQTTFSANADSYLAFTKEERDTYAKAINEFKSLCTKYDIEHVVHEESEEWHVDELVKESRFADLLLVNGELFFSDIKEEQPNHFLRDVLTSSECPVLIIPNNVQPIERVAVAYNGNKESVFALKMFCYLFPHLTGLPVNIYYFVDKTDDEIPDFEFIKELAGRHFSDINFRELFFDPEKYLNTWITDYKNTIVICGSYHRSKLSRMIKRSFAEDIIRSHSVPIFVAHQ